MTPRMGRHRPRAAGGAVASKRQEGALPPLTRTDAATEAGLSEHQRKTTLRVGNGPGRVQRYAAAT
jgi:hypothetical protein